MLKTDMKTDYNELVFEYLSKLSNYDKAFCHSIDKKCWAYTLKQAILNRKSTQSMRTAAKKWLQEQIAHDQFIKKGI